MINENDKPNTGQSAGELQTTDTSPSPEETLSTEPVAPVMEQQEQEQVTAAQSEKKAPRRRRLPLWARIILRTLRLLLVPILCVIALFGGLIVGYVYIGGQEMDDVWKLETWRYVFDLMFKDTL